MSDAERQAAEGWFRVRFFDRISDPQFDGNYPARIAAMAKDAADFAETLALAERAAHSYIDGEQWVHSRRWVNDTPLPWTAAVEAMEKEKP